MFDFIKKLKEDKSGATKTRKGKGYYLEVNEAQVAQALNGDRPAKADSEAKVTPAKTEAPKAAPAKTEAPKAEAVKAAKPVVAAATKKETPVATTFAPNYLLTLTSTNGRRSPGANMSSFLEMARKVKTPNS